MNFSSIECNFDRKLENENLNILTDIISNYLYEYFNDGTYFLSISSSSSDLGQQQLHEDLSRNLLIHSKLANFSYIFLNGIAQSQPGENAFNLILIDRSSSMM